MSGVVANFFKEAIEWCCQKDRIQERELYKKLLEGNRLSHSRLRYSLARELARFFHHHIPGAKAVYIYGSAVSDSAHLSSDLDLLILVDRKEAQSMLFVEEIDYHLCHKYTSYLGLEEKRLTKLLHVILIDEDQLKQRRGRAVLINSPFTPALRISNIV